MNGIEGLNSLSASSASSAVNQLNYQTNVVSTGKIYVRSENTIALSLEKSTEPMDSEIKLFFIYVLYWDSKFHLFIYSSEQVYVFNLVRLK